MTYRKVTVIMHWLFTVWSNAQKPQPNALYNRTVLLEFYGSVFTFHQPFNLTNYSQACTLPFKGLKRKT